MTRRLIATAILAVTVGGPVFASVPAHANYDGSTLICIGSDNSKSPGATKLCINDPTQGWQH